MSFYSTYNDVRLLKLLREGDAIAFTEIYYRYWEKMLAIALNFTQDQQSAKEIVQDLFVCVWERRERFDIEKLENYLVTAVKFNFFKMIERRKRQTEIEKGLYTDYNKAELDQTIESRFFEEYLLGHIDRLPEKCRLVFNYSHIHHMSNEEIAAKLSISQKTVEGHLTNGKKLLRVYLKDSGLLTILGISMYEFLK